MAATAERQACWRLFGGRVLAATGWWQLVGDRLHGKYAASGCLGACWRKGGGSKHVGGCWQRGREADASNAGWRKVRVGGGVNSKTESAPNGLKILNLQTGTRTSTRKAIPAQLQEHTPAVPTGVERVAARGVNGKGKGRCRSPTCLNSWRELSAHNRCWEACKHSRRAR